MADLLFSNKAVEDLTNIWNYTAGTWPEAQADKYYTLLIATCRQIAPALPAGNTRRSWPDCPDTGQENTLFSIGRFPGMP